MTTAFPRTVARLVLSAAVLASAPVATLAADANQKAIAAEEKDRLAREKKELLARTDSLQKQLDTSRKLVAEKEALRQQLLAEIASLKTAAKPAAAKK